MVKTLPPQLARNLMEKHQLVTQNIRPASMWYLIENSRQHAPQMEQHPDIVKKLSSEVEDWVATLPKKYLKTGNKED